MAARLSSALCSAARPLSFLRWQHTGRSALKDHPYLRKRVTKPGVAAGSAMDGASGSAQAATEVVFNTDGSLAGGPTKLSAVVHDALRRWYLETEREAQRGDVKSQALLGQMLIEGYGCAADLEKGREWAEKARRRGYRMQGVYCRI